MLHVITTIESGGAENQLLTIARYQVQKGNQVSVLFLKGEPTLLEAFEKNGVEVVSAVANFSALTQLCKLFQQIKKLQPGVVHAHLPRSELMVSIFSLASRAPFVVSKHNTEIMFPPKPKLSRILSRFVSSRSDATIYISYAVKDFLIKSGEIVASKRDFLVHYGIDITRACKHQTELARERKPENNSIQAACFSRLVPQKNLFRLMKAISYISKAGVPINLDVFGQGYLKDSLIEEVQKLNISKYVHFKGSVPYAERLLEKYDVFVLVSHYEGFGLSILEALARGIPAVVSDLEVTREILGSNYPFFVDPLDISEIAEVILMASKANLKEFHKTSKDIVEKFSAIKAVDDLETVYRFALT